MLCRQRNRFPAALVLAGALLLPIAPAAAAGAPPKAESAWEALWSRLLAWAGLGDQDPTPVWAAEDVGPRIDPNGLQAPDSNDAGPRIDPDGLR